MAGKRAEDANASFQWREPIAKQRSLWSFGEGNPEGCFLILVEMPCSKYFRKLPLSPDSCWSTLTVGKFTFTYIQSHICTHVWTYTCAHTHRALLGFKYKTILTMKIKPFCLTWAKYFYSWWQRILLLLQVCFPIFHGNRALKCSFLHGYPKTAFSCLLCTVLVDRMWAEMSHLLLGPSF